MLELGLASSHAPAMFEPKERWPLVYSRIPEYTKESQPHTAKLETPEVIQGYIDRINAAFDVLRQQLEAYQPEALIVVGDDQVTEVPEVKGDAVRQRHLLGFSRRHAQPGEYWAPLARRFEVAVYRPGLFLCRCHGRPPKKG